MQLNIFIETGASLRDKGIAQAIDHADKVEEKWSEKAYDFLLKYIQSHDEFMAENVREASKGILSEPPNLRAWGGIFMKARCAGLIYRITFKSVENAKAHCANASFWGVVKK